MVDLYEKLQDIGNGSFGKVCKIRRKTDGQILVWKELNYGKMSEKEKQQLVSEVNILRELSHSHIVQYHDRIIDKANAKIYIIMEYCEGGDLQQIIRKARKQQDYIAEDIIWKILTQITLGLQHCHRRSEQQTKGDQEGKNANPKILHRDLKPGNIFLDSHKNVKIGDFGLARVMNQESQFAYTHVGTPYYMSPEQINESKYNEQSDIWSLGCIIYELAALHPPFTAQNHLSLAMKIKAGKFERVPGRYSEELQRVCSWMLSQNSCDRPTVDDLMNLPQVTIREREMKLQETIGYIKRKEEELRAKEQIISDREQSLKDKELKLIEKEALINELLKSQDHKSNDLIRSLQRLASTRGGESSLAGSERVSLGSKLKESKMSAVSFSGFENSARSHQKHKLHKFKSDPEFITMEEAQKLQQSKISQRDDEDSVAIVKGNHLISSQSVNDSRVTYTSNARISSGSRKQQVSMEKRYHTQPACMDDEEAEYNFRGSDDEEQDIESFRQTVFNPQVKSGQSRNNNVHGTGKAFTQNPQTNKIMRTQDDRVKVSRPKNTHRVNSLQKAVAQRQDDIQKLSQQINNIPLPNNARVSSQSKLNHNPSMETLLTKKLNDSTQRISQKTTNQKGFLQQASQKVFIRQDSLQRLATFQGNMLQLGNQSFEKSKNQTQNFMNITAELMNYLENGNQTTNKVDKSISMNQKTLKRCPTASKQRPPLTDRTNVILSQKYQSNQSQKQQQQQHLLQQQNDQSSIIQSKILNQLMMQSNMMNGNNC